MHLDRLPWVFCHHFYVFVKHKLDQISTVPNRERICLIFPEKPWIPSTVASIFQDSWSQEPTNAGMIQVCLFFFPDVSCPGLRMNRTSWRERNSSISVWCAPLATSIRGTLGSFWVHLKPPPDGQRRQRMLRKVRETTKLSLFDATQIGEVLPGFVPQIDFGSR